MKKKILLGLLYYIVLVIFNSIVLHIIEIYKCPVEEWDALIWIAYVALGLCFALFYKDVESWII